MWDLIKNFYRLLNDKYDNYRICIEFMRTGMILRIYEEERAMRRFYSYENLELKSNLYDDSIENLIDCFLTEFEEMKNRENISKNT